MINTQISFKNNSAYIVEKEHPCYNKRDMEDIEINSLIPYLQDTLIIEEGICLKDIWKYIEHDPKILEMIFCGAMGGCSLAGFIKESKKTTNHKKEKANDSMQGLELYWVSGYEKGDKKQKNIEIYPEFNGYGLCSEEYINNGEPFESSFAVEYTSVNKLMNYPIRIDNQLEITNIWTKCRGDVKTIIKADKELTVYDMLFAILHKITWCGPPSFRNKKVKEISKSLEESIVDKENTIPMEEVLKN